MYHVERRRPNDTNWELVYGCETPDLAVREIHSRRLADHVETMIEDLPKPLFYYRMVERCDVCGKEITDENRGQTTTEGIICLECLQKRT